MATKNQLIERVEADRETIISFLRGLIAAKSPNPPGDTREAASYVGKFLDERGIRYWTVGPDAEKPNIVSNVKFGKPGRNLVMNGHIDVFPVGDGAGWNHPPWDGALVDGRIYGRGACDMKAGTTASIYAYAVLNELGEELSGSATLTVVSDEESGGRLGSGWLVENVPEVKGDCCHKRGAEQPVYAPLRREGNTLATSHSSSPRSAWSLHAPEPEPDQDSREACHRPRGIKGRARPVPL